MDVCVTISLYFSNRPLIKHLSGYFTQRYQFSTGFALWHCDFFTQSNLGLERDLAFVLEQQTRCVCLIISTLSSVFVLLIKANNSTQSK